MAEGCDRCPRCHGTRPRHAWSCYAPEAYVDGHVPKGGWAPPADVVASVLRQRDALRAAIRQHRDQRGHDRCWLDDAELYAALPEGNTGDQSLPPRVEFLAGCERYYELRRSGVAPATTAGMAEACERLRARVTALEGIADLARRQREALRRWDGLRGHDANERAELWTEYARLSRELDAALGGGEE